MYFHEDSSDYDEGFIVSVMRENYGFNVFVKGHYSGNSFFRKTMC